MQSLKILAEYPYMLPATFNLIIQMISICLVIAMFPKFPENKKMYHKFQSTLFF